MSTSFLKPVVTSAFRHGELLFAPEGVFLVLGTDHAAFVLKKIETFLYLQRM